MFIEVTVRDRETGIVGVHYVEVSDSLVYPEQNAACQEHDKGFEVVATKRWNQTKPSLSAKYAKELQHVLKK